MIAKPSLLSTTNTQNATKARWNGTSSSTRLRPRKSRGQIADGAVEDQQRGKGRRIGQEPLVQVEDIAEAVGLAEGTAQDALVEGAQNLEIEEAADRGIDALQIVRLPADVASNRMRELDPDRHEPRKGGHDGDRGRAAEDERRAPVAGRSHPVERIEPEQHAGVCRLLQEIHGQEMGQQQRQTEKAERHVPRPEAAQNQQDSGMMISTAKLMSFWLTLSVGRAPRNDRGRPR